jgi:hypothetical protein
MKLKILSPDQLRSLIEEATIDQSEEQWHVQFMQSVAGLIEKRPIVYRSFGPFWWTLKKYLLDGGLIVGEPVDAELFDQVTMGSQTLDLAAAFAYHDWTTSNMTSADTVRQVETDEGETIEYPVIDEEFEAVIAFP